jgi:hypothetical protein
MPEQPIPPTRRTARIAIGDGSDTSDDRLRRSFVDAGRAIPPDVHCPADAGA